MNTPLKTTVRPHVERKPRYEVRPCNGVYQVFDAFRYEAVDSCPTEFAALAVCRGHNAIDAQKRKE